MTPCPTFLYRFCGIKLRSSYLQGKLFTNWAISPVPINPQLLKSHVDPNTLSGTIYPHFINVKWSLENPVLCLGLFLRVLHQYMIPFLEIGGACLSSSLSYPLAQGNKLLLYPRWKWLIFSVVKYLPIDKYQLLFETLRTWVLSYLQENAQILCSPAMCITKEIKSTSTTLAYAF